MTSRKFWKRKDQTETGKYQKPKDITRDEAIEQLEKSRKEWYGKKLSIESMTAKHFSSRAEESSYSDNVAFYSKILEVTVCVDFPEVYKITYNHAAKDSDEEDENDNTYYVLANIEAYWNSKHNVLLVKRDRLNNVKKVLKKFERPPKVITEGIWNALLLC